VIEEYLVALLDFVPKKVPGLKVPHTVPFANPITYEVVIGVGARLGLE
jgi:hypothetical protein